MNRPSFPSYAVRAIALAVVVGLAAVQGCAVPQAGGASTETAAQPAATAQWTTVAGALGTEEAAGGNHDAGAGFSSDPVLLEQALAGSCSDGKASGSAGYLRPLVGRLYSSGIDPATSMEALIRVGCAPLSALVRELVAQGGEPAVAPVVQRALFLAGPGARGLVETAASDGLGADLGGVGREGAAAGEALAWVPAGGRSAPTVAAKGYGLYTFVLPGRSGVSVGGTSPDRLGELLRVIEIYTLSADTGGGGPSWGRQAFLLPVDPARQGEPLPEQISAALATDARAALAVRLRYLGREGLAARLETSPGPFLISAAQPGLLPGGRADAGARLLVDLSGLGPEYMYAVVDAYDRPIPDDAQGTGGALDPIRTRLLALFGEHSGDVAAARDQTFLLSLQAPTAEPAADGG